MAHPLADVGFRKMKIRTAFSLLLLATLIAAAYYLLIYIPKHGEPGDPVLVVPNYFLTYAPIQPINEAAYVVPDSLQVWDTPAEIRRQIANLKSDEQVYALGHFRQWIHVRMLDGHDGWVHDDGLLTAATHAEDQRLLKETADVQVQAMAHAADLSNVHIEPSRKAAVVAEVKPNQNFAVFGRRMVERPHENSTPHAPAIASKTFEAWYLVRTGSRTGWILGKLVQLDIPKSISAYAQSVNLVAWLVVDTVNDNGHGVPQYLVADRIGTETYDFSHIRVLTWWKKKQTYAIAYKEGDLQGVFPILVTHQGSVPCFGLRLVDSDGTKYQKIYGLFDTVTRLMGRVDGWESEALPERPTSRPRSRMKIRRTRSKRRVRHT